jgi:fumarate reductase subunit C
MQASGGLSFRLYILQRLSALIMAPLLILHLGVMIYAIQGGLDAAEILGRTQGSIFWGLVYGLFVMAVAIHAAIGLRVVGHEWSQFGSRPLGIVSWLIALLILTMGWRAVYAVVAI